MELVDVAQFLQNTLVPVGQNTLLFNARVTMAGARVGITEEACQRLHGGVLYRIWQ